MKHDLHHKLDLLGWTEGGESKWRLALFALLQEIVWVLAKLAKEHGSEIVTGDIPAGKAPPPAEEVER